MHDKLKAILKDRIECESKINRIVICQAGGVRYSKRNPSGTLDDQELLKKQQFPSIQDEILPALKKHSNVFEASMLVEKEDIPTLLSSDAEILSGVPFHCKIRMPERLHKYRGILPSVTPIEDFEVISRGSVFYAFAEVPDYSSWTFLGHEFRELFRKQIESETDFNCPIFGPSPIHPVFVLIFLEPTEIEGKISEVETRVLAHDGNILILLDQATDPKGAVFDLMIETESTIVDFYRIQSIRSSLIERVQKIENSFRDLESSTRELALTPWYQFRRVKRVTARARGMLHDIAVSRVDKDAIASKLEQKRNHFLEKIKNNPFLSKVLDYFAEHGIDDFSQPQSLHEAVRYLTGELNTHTSKRLIVLASIIGAVAGALLTFILNCTIIADRPGPSQLYQPSPQESQSRPAQQSPSGDVLKAAPEE